MCLCKLPLELFSHFLTLFYGLLHHSRGGIIPFLPCLLLCNDSLKLFLFFLLYLSLAHIELLLLLHAVMARPKLEAEAQERCQGIMVNDTKLIIAVMHYRVYMTF